SRPLAGLFVSDAEVTAAARHHTTSGRQTEYDPILRPTRSELALSGGYCSDGAKCRHWQQAQRGQGRWNRSQDACYETFGGGNSCLIFVDVFLNKDRRESKDEPRRQGNQPTYTARCNLFAEQQPVDDDERDR